MTRGDPDYRDTPGALQEKVVWIGGHGDIAYSTYNPTPPEDISRCLSETIAYMRGDADELYAPGIITRMASPMRILRPCIHSRTETAASAGCCCR